MAFELPIEILTMILSVLGLSDLLNCRLVDRSWNRMSLLVFRKSTFQTHLTISSTGGNAENYIQFVSTKNPQLVLPMHLFLESSQPTFPTSQDSDTVTSLQTTFGHDSIHSLTMDIGQARVEEGDKNVIKLISRVSHALKTLHVKCYYVSSTEEFLLDLIQDLTFPNVTSLKYLNKHINPFMEIQSQFIKKCPNLRQLSLRSESHDITFLTSLQKLALHSLTDPQQFWNKILGCSRLHTIKIRWHRSRDRQIIYDILKSLVKTLKSLTIGIGPTFQFPQLHYLESLRLCNMTERFTALQLNPDEMNFNTQTFPALKSVGLPSIFFLSQGSPLLSVNTLILGVSANSRIPYLNPDFSMQENFKSLSRIFPNATTVSLKQQIGQEFQCKTVLKELISSDLAPQIQQIQIDGGRSDILGEIMEQNQIPPQIMMIYSGQRNYGAEALIQQSYGLWTGQYGIKGIEYKDEGAGNGSRVVFAEGSQSGHKMTNVRKVKILFKKLGDVVNDGYYDGGDLSNLKLNLMSTVKNLPGVTEIELIGIKKELYLKYFDDLAIEYPNLLLRITKSGSKN